MSISSTNFISLLLCWCLWDSIPDVPEPSMISCEEWGKEQVLLLLGMLHDVLCDFPALLL